MAITWKPLRYSRAHDGLAMAVGWIPAAIAVPISIGLWYMLKTAGWTALTILPAVVLILMLLACAVMFALTFIAQGIGPIIWNRIAYHYNRNAGLEERPMNEVLQHYY